jgi:hypothetical protein
VCLVLMVAASVKRPVGVFASTCATVFPSRTTRVHVAKGVLSFSDQTA